jgi:hypothetical protein
MAKKLGSTLTIVLLSLVFVHRRYYLRKTKESVTLTPVVQNVFDERPLASIRGQNSNFMRWIAEESHVHEQRHCIFGLAQVLDEVGRRYALAFAFVVRNVDELVIKFETRVRSGKFCRSKNRR